MAKEQVLYSKNDIVFISCVHEEEFVVDENEMLFIEKTYVTADVNVVYRIKFINFADVKDNDCFSYQVKKNKELSFKFKTLKDDIRVDEDGKLYNKVYIKGNGYSISFKISERKKYFFANKMNPKTVVKKEKIETKHNKNSPLKKKTTSSKKKKKYSKEKWLIDHPLQGGAFSPR